ncbi:MAG: YjbF family lipoprotein [Celeribacter sp.]|jgi:hypothetical protein
MNMRSGLLKPLSLALLLIVSACARPAPPDLRATLTRAQIDAFEQPLILVELPQLGSSATLIPVARNGDVQTWSTADGVGLSYERGLPVATRGLGVDLMGADVTGSLAALNSGGGTTAYYPRFHSHLDGAQQIRYLSFQCQITGRRAETITLIGQRHAVQRIDETCHLPDARVENSYWRGIDGTLWRTKQWLSEDAGYLITERLRK